MSIIHISVGTSFPPSSSSSVSFPGNPAHLGADVSQEEESHCASHAGDLSYPEGCGPAVVLGNCTERQSSQETPNIGHEGHDGMGGATQVGRGTFIGYDPKQGNRPIRGESKHSSQSQNPQLSKSQTGSVNLTTIS